MALGVLKAMSLERLERLSRYTKLAFEAPRLDETHKTCTLERLERLDHLKY